MFTALILACVMSAPTQCIEAEDSYGPYETKGQCVMRVHEMVAQMRMAFPVPHTYRYKCVEQPITKEGISL